MGGCAIYAIIETGGKQYRVTPGQVLDVERLAAEEDSDVTFDRVLMAADDGGRVLVGQPTVAGAAVTAKVITEHKGLKVIVFKYKSKTRYRRFRGHRQTHTRLSIQEISLPDNS